MTAPASNPGNVPGAPGPSSGQTPERAGGWVVLWIVLGLGALVAGGWVAAYFGAGDKVPKGTTVAGVDIGGKTQSQAATLLEEELGDRLGETVEVTVGDESVEIVPADAGYSIEYVESVADAGGEKSWSPARLWDYYTGGGEELDPVVRVDASAADAALRPLADAVDQAPVDGAVEFKQGRVVTSDAETGRGIDLGQAREQIAGDFLTADGSVELELTDLEPEVDQADVDRAVEEFANPAMSGPVRLVFGQESVALRPRDYSKALSMAPNDGALSPVVDEKAFAKLLSGKVSEADKPVDATVELVKGKPKVIPAKPGVSFEPEAVESVFLELLTEDGDREGEVEATVKEPDFSTADAKKLGIKQKVSSEFTNFPYAEYRNVNIGRAGELIDGTVLKPGETFSLNDTVGERTAENGFTTGFIISDGIFKEDYGGGVSQMATTTYNAAFFAGLKDVEHKPHSFYIDRYPAGREATVAWGAVDLRFKNDTPYGILIDVDVTPSSAASQGTARVTMWSTKHWDITTKTSDPYNQTSPGTRTLTTADCYPNTGYGGFDVDVWRYFSKPGEDSVEKTEKYHTTYIPSDTVICKQPEPDKPDKPGNAGDD